MVDQVANGIFRVPIRVIEANQIRQTVIAEKHGYRLFPEQERTVNRRLLFQRLLFFRQAKAVVTHGIAARGPLKAVFTKQSQGILAQATFRCPAACSLLTKEPLKYLLAHTNVPVCPVLTAGIG